MIDTRTMTEKRLGQGRAAGVHEDQRRKGHTKSDRQHVKASLRKEWTR